MQRFTGQERDQETTPLLDYFQGRYYSAEQGRFLSPDPLNAGANLYNPQSWNAYSYVLNNPLTNVDPTGLNCITLDNGQTADDGQGSPCAGSQTPDIINVNAQQTSLFDYLYTISTNEILRYDPYDQPLETDARSVITATYLQTKKYSSCLGVPLELGGAGGALYVSGQPKAGFRSPVTGKLVGGSKPFASGGASAGSSTLSGALRDALPQRLPTQVPTPVGGLGTGRAFSMQGSNRLGVVLGRYAPFVGVALTAYSLYDLNKCLSQ